MANQHSFKDISQTIIVMQKLINQSSVTD